MTNNLYNFSCSSLWLMAAVVVVGVTTTAFAFVGPQKNDKTVRCGTTTTKHHDDEEEEISHVFPDEILHFDHYNGITIHLERCTEELESTVLDEANFESALRVSLKEWTNQKRKGIWIHCPVENASLVPIATKLGFDFHMVHNKNILVLSQWLQNDLNNKLPNGPTHQVGVGTLVLCPWDHSKMLVVQEKTGPAAAYGLWKMPTGLSDPGEDIHLAAERELMEEVGMASKFEGIIAFRQAHGSRSGTRASSDLFFVCQMKLQLPHDFDHKKTNGEELFKACPDEIAAIKWMPVQEYCNQERWQTSPVYKELNDLILKASKMQGDSSTFLINHCTLPLGFGLSSNKDTNTLYYRQKSIVTKPL